MKNTPKKTSPSQNHPVIEVDHLVKRYKTSTQNSVDDISFSVKAGEFFTFLGPNGAGKTTTISILNTTLAKTAGVVRVAGHDVETQPQLVRAKIGVIFQNPSLDLNLTAEENVRFHAMLYGVYRYAPTFGLMPKVYRDKVGELAELLGIHAQIHQPIKTFSGGMKRKLEIVRGLIHNPQILFLDEPTTGLDPESRHNLWKYLQMVRRDQNTTIFLTTHYLDEAENSDRVCIITKGKIVALSTPDKLKKDWLKEKVTVDSLDRAKLKTELKRHKFEVAGTGPFTITINSGHVAEVVQKIDTKLSLLQTEIMSLEQAYLTVLKKYSSPAEEEIIGTTNLTTN